MTKSVRNPGDPEVEDLPVTPDDMAAMGLQSGDAAMRGEKPAPMPRVPRVPKKELSEEEQAALEEMGSAAKEVPFEVPEPGDEWPEWVVVPPNLPKVAPGTLVSAMLFESDVCANPVAGDHHCLLWTLTDKEQGLAYKRTNGVSERAIMELAKGAIRSCDGHKVQWPPGCGIAGDIGAFWEAIGAKGRSMLVEWYVNTHAYTKEERVRFFGRCIATKRAG